jgi:hypothetical protein
MDALHAKVYWSGKGAFVGSANLSSGGLHDLRPEFAANVEAGIFVEAGTPLHQEIGRWCEKQYGDADTISDALMRQQKMLWDNRSKPDFAWRYDGPNSFSFGDLMMKPEAFMIAFYDECDLDEDKTKIMHPEVGMSVTDYLKQGACPDYFVETCLIGQAPNKRAVNQLMALLSSRTIITVSARTKVVGRRVAEVKLTRKSEFALGEYHSYRRAKMNGTDEEALLVFLKSHDFNDTTAKDDQNNIIEALKTCQSTKLWKRWLMGELPRDWFGSELYLRGELFERMLEQGTGATPTQVSK